jgi:peptidoglycan/xylan/chitin deacetylase (PgdA/CDA1 family)
MRIPGLKTLKKSALRVRKRFKNGVLILGYHRVAALSYDPYRLSVAPDVFAEQLELLTRTANILRLSEMLAHLQARSMPRRSVVVTFDDGYLDNLTHALPVLERCQAPATVFVIAGTLGQELWWDKLARLVADADLESLIGYFSLDRFAFRRSEKSGMYAANGAGMREARQRLLDQLYTHLSLVDCIQREEFLQDLESDLGIVRNQNYSDRMMTGDELRQLSTSGLVEIGSHSLTHPQLSNLPEAELNREIEYSKACLEGMLDKEVSAFSYPFGMASPPVRTRVAGAGYDCACASHNDLVWEGSSLYHLPRVWVPNQGGAGFTRWLERWLAD